jgi:hypothetical protein
LLSDKKAEGKKKEKFEPRFNFNTSLYFTEDPEPGVRLLRLDCLRFRLTNVAHELSKSHRC